MSHCNGRTEMEEEDSVVFGWTLRSLIQTNMVPEQHHPLKPTVLWSGAAVPTKHTVSLHSAWKTSHSHLALSFIQLRTCRQN